MQNKADVNDRDYFKNPLSRTEVDALLQGRPASDMFNFRSPSFKKLGLDREKLSHEALIDLMLKEPRLVRRPVVKIGKKVHFGATATVLNELLG